MVIFTFFTFKSSFEKKYKLFSIKVHLIVYNEKLIHCKKQALKLAQRQCCILMKNNIRIQNNVGNNIPCIPRTKLHI